MILPNAFNFLYRACCLEFDDIVKHQAIDDIGACTLGRADHDRKKVVFFAGYKVQMRVGLATAVMMAMALGHVRAGRIKQIRSLVWPVSLAA
jgi:hypothetical protein